MNPPSPRLLFKPKPSFHPHPTIYVSHSVSRRSYTRKSLPPNSHTDT